MGKFLKHPLGQAVLVLLVIAYILLDYGIAVPPAAWWGSQALQIPNSVVFQFLDHRRCGRSCSGSATTKPVGRSSNSRSIA